MPLAAIIHTLPAVASNGSAAEPLRDVIERGLISTTEPTIPGSRPEDNEWAYTKTVTPLVHYDAEGLVLFDQIAIKAADYYYPFNDELNIFKHHGPEIAKAVGIDGGDAERGWDVVELGAGALRKTAHLLTALADTLPRHKTDSNPAPISYYALDLSKDELDRVLVQLDDAYGPSFAGRVDRFGLHADYDSGLHFVREGGLAKLSAERSGAPTPAPARPLHFVFIGSSLGNFDREGGASFLSSLPLRKGDTLLIGIDGRPPAGPEGRKKVETAYNDPNGAGRAFEEHGWVVVRRELGLEPDEGIEWVNRYNEPLGRHECYYRVKKTNTVHLPNRNVDVELKEGELLHVEWSHKWSYEEAIELFAKANLQVINSWKAPTSEYRVWVVERKE
ncbi:hypothetical protein DXG03_000473 [Asterophora parasitica]|uniref:Histidine-specific methyltransferase SAM-dependent domain-containing protein n=1 Tax=Asterophora parasitica TaxID=117018 RepID=A0A9P7GB81_9AGAR|nr:hypothetical protein DXG03_000473 [Asterophora parasitica]